MRRSLRVRRVLRACLGVLAVATSVVAVHPDAAAAETITFSPHGSLVVSWRGNGHGHGMSQYGARGAARAGLSYRRILAFYYPHARLTTTRQPSIRVLLSDFGDATIIGASRGLRVTGVRGTLASRGVARYRLVANSGRGLVLQRLGSGRSARWQTLRRHLGNGSQFYIGRDRSVRVYAPNGTSNLYRGAVRSVRRTSSGMHGVNSVNVVGLERYVAGVAPREMPASWPFAATEVQAVAARTYARYALDHPRGSYYDICDTTDCQFYGGYAYLDAHGNAVWRDDTRAVAATANRVLTYRGWAILAQFSASDGGWSVSGGEPYLVARRDPYDSRGSGDPYLARSARRRVSTLAAYFGLSTVSRVVVTRRDGHGTWGGRVLSAVVYGTRGTHAKRVHASGFDLQWALGADTNWLHITRG